MVILYTGKRAWLKCLDDNCSYKSQDQVNWCSHMLSEHSEMWVQVIEELEVMSSSDEEDEEEEGLVEVSEGEEEAFQ